MVLFEGVDAVVAIGGVLGGGCRARAMSPGRHSLRPPRPGLSRPSRASLTQGGLRQHGRKGTTGDTGVRGKGAAWGGGEGATTGIQAAAGRGDPEGTRQGALHEPRVAVRAVQSRLRGPLEVRFFCFCPEHGNVI